MSKIPFTADHSTVYWWQTRLMLTPLGCHCCHCVAHCLAHCQDNPATHNLWHLPWKWNWAWVEHLTEKCHLLSPQNLEAAWSTPCPSDEAILLVPFPMYIQNLVTSHHFHHYHLGQDTDTHLLDYAAFHLVPLLSSLPAHHLFFNPAVEGKSNYSTLLLKTI